MIFREHIGGYRSRTIENTKADVTIAIAKDFNTAGEVLTRNSVAKQGNLYIKVPYNSISDLVLPSYRLIVKQRVMNTLNIAGNGIYTLNEEQSIIDDKVYDYLSRLFRLLPKPQLIRSGGQTGIDEAGLKAAVKLGIPALCLAPKGWIFRDINHKDIANEQLFKQRFV